MSKRFDRTIIYQGKTIIPDVTAIVTATHTKQGNIRLRGQLRNAATGAVLEKGTSIATSPEETLIRAQALVVRLVQKQKKRNEKTAKTLTGTAIFSSAYDGLTDNEKMELCPATWGETTRRQALTYFERTALPILDTYGGSITQADADDILEIVRKKAFANTRRGESESITEAKVRQHAVEFNRLYPMFRLTVGEELLPELKLPVPYRQRMIRSEHTKALPLVVQVKQIALYYRLASNGLMLGAVLMKLGGLRTAEACGLRYRDIELFEDYAVIWVLRQLKDDELSNDLKRDDSYRPVIVPRLAVDLLQVRIEYLVSLGYQRDQIDEMPVVSRWDDPTQWAQKGDLSGFIREILKLLGMTDDDWDAVGETMRKEKDLDESNKPITDPSAYLERRNSCSMNISVCGIDSDLEDCLAGRKIYCGSIKAEQIDNYIHNKDKWPEIAAKLERLVLDPNHTANPLYRPIPLRKGVERVFCDAQAGFTFVAEEDCEVEIIISTTEAGDAVVVEGDARLLNATAVSNPFVESGGTVIGAVKKREEYERLIAEANVLEISTLLPGLPQRPQEEQQHIELKEGEGNESNEGQIP